MKSSFIILFLLIGCSAFGQKKERELIRSIKGLHEAMVKKDTRSIGQYTDIALSYGHSNGWIETRSEMIRNLETGFISYTRFKEDSIIINKNGNLASVRFIGDITATLDGKTVDYHLKVLEVWVYKNGKWMLFARQALK